MEISLKRNYGFELIFKAENVNVCEDIEERIYGKTEDGKTDYKNVKRDVKTDAIEKFVSILDDLISKKNIILQIITTKTNGFVGGTEIILENKGENKGQITVNNKSKGIYQMYWGAMGGTIQDFLLQINSDYFTDKLLGAMSTQTFDCKGTFAAVRKFIREELDLPCYKHQEFQANLRENLKIFQERCEEYNSDKYFVDHFHDYLYRYPSFYLIDDRYEQ